MTWALEIAIAFAIVVLTIGLAIWLAPKGWRTYAANGALVGLVAVGAVLEFAVGFDWKEVLPPSVAPWVVLAVNVLNIALRSVTTTPPGEPGA